MSALNRAMELRGQVSGTKEQPNIDTRPGKTIAGGLTSALGGAATGAALSAAIPAIAGGPLVAPIIGATTLLAGAEYFTR